MNPHAQSVLLPAESMRGGVLCIDFRDALTMAKDGWNKASLPLIDKGITTDGVDDNISWTGVLFDVQGTSFWITLESTTEEIITLSATHSVSVTAGVLAATGWTAPTIMVNGVATTAIGTGRSFVTITTGTAFTANTIVVGEIAAAFGAFKMEDLKLWGSTTELSLAEHLAYYNNSMWNWENLLTTNLQFRHLDYDPTNVRTLDSSGNGNHGTFVGTPDQYTGYMGFSTAEYLTTPWAPGLSGTLACTVRGTGAGKSLMGSTVAGATPRCYLYVNASGVLCGGVALQNLTIITGTSKFNTGQVKTGILTWDGTTVNLYIDGRAEHTAAQAGSTTGASAIRVGDISNFSNPAGYYFYNAETATEAWNPTQVLDYHQKQMSIIGSEF